MRILTSAALLASAAATGGPAAATGSWPSAAITSGDTFDVTGVDAGSTTCYDANGVTSAVTAIKDANNANAAVTSSLTGTTCTYDISALVNGDYKFTEAGTDKTVTIDKPIAATAFVGDVDRDIVLGQSLVGGTALWKITQSTLAGTGNGFTLVGDVFGTARLHADKVTGSGSSTWTLTASDGTNTKTITVAVTVRADNTAATAAAPVASLTFTDSRGTSGAQRVAGGGTFYSSAANFDIKFSFSEPMSAGAATITTSGSATFSAPVVTNSGRTHTITVTGAANSDTITIPAGLFVKTADNTVLSAAVSAVTVKLQANSAFASTAGANTGEAALLSAGVGLDYWNYIPATLFSGAQGPVEITSVTSPQLGAGLRLLPGKLGRAAIQGKISAANLPAASSQTGCFSAASVNQVVFTVSAKDATGKTADAIFCVGVESTPAESGAITAFNGASLAAAEGTAATVDAAATTTIASATKLIAYLETPDSDATNEQLANGGASASAGDYSASLFMATKATGITNAATAQAALRAVAYTNSNEGAVSTDAVNKRNVRVAFAKTSPTGAIAAGATEGLCLGVATRPLKYSVENDAPVLGGATTAITFTEGDAKAVLFADFTITDVDDTTYRSAVVSIGAGKLATDRLGLSSVSTTVSTIWDAASGKLTIGPAPGASSISAADLQAAVRSVAFFTSKGSDPNSGTAAGTVARTVTVTVFDDASNKKVNAPATSSVSKTLNVVSVESAPQFIPAKAYGQGGIFASTDANANEASINGVTVRKPVIIRDAGAAASGVKLTFDFNKVKDSVYAGGALVFSDAKETFLTGAADITIGTIAKATTATGTLSVTSSATALSAAAGTSPQLYEISLDATSSTAGQFTIPLFYTHPNTGVKTRMDLVVDVREKACHLGAFDAATQYPDPSACTAFTASVVNGAAAQLFGGLAATAVDSVRGAFTLDSPAGSIAATSSVQLRGKPVSATQTGQLPVHPTPGSMVDLTTAVSFGPAGTQFTAPATVCVNVGKVPANYKAVLAVSSQVDVNDETKGYTNWELLANQAVTAVTNSDKICAELSHFSIVAPVLIPTSNMPSAQKSFQMGASCPNSCSGKGFCREQGQCVCFDGFTGYDCAQRTCPADESWDVSADGTTHANAECSSRGACDRKTGLCACYPGFEGSACNRVSCPNDCSGHGKCRLVESVGSWEDERVQACMCDDGYTGNDCSQRICPFGDDPETVCMDNDRQIQRVSIDFGTLPAGIDGTSAAFTDLYANDELTLSFTTKSNHVLYTPTITDAWDNGAGAKLAAALKALPSFAVSDVSVSSAVAANLAKVDYDVTFTGASLLFNYNSMGLQATAVSDNTVAGTQNLLACDNIPELSFINGCVGQGCRPAHKQPRLLEADVISGVSIASVNDKSVLQQPGSQPVSGTNNFDTAGVWGVQVLVTVTSDGTATGSTYKYDVTTYGEYQWSSDEMPLPYDADGKLRTNVPIAYGLNLDFSQGAIAAGTNQMLFSWRLPKCSVTEVAAASPDYESFECSNRGVCDRKSGTCSCFNGYSGASCSQQTVIV